MNTARKLPTRLGGRGRGCSLPSDEVEATGRQAVALMKALTMAMDVWDESIARATALHKDVAAEICAQCSTGCAAGLVAELGAAIAAAAVGGAGADKALRAWVELVGGPIEPPVAGARAAAAGATQ